MGKGSKEGWKLWAIAPRDIQVKVEKRKFLGQRLQGKVELWAMAPGDVQVKR